MKALQKWERASNYSGENFDAYYCGPGQHRDSDLIEQSNFVCALEDLGGESETVIVKRDGHWAVGWVEQILVHESDANALKKLQEIYDALERYPILNDEDHSDREHEYYRDYANGAKEQLAKGLAMHLDLSKPVARSKALRDIAYQLNMECQYQHGPDSCIDVYDIPRKPEQRDLIRVQECLSEAGYRLKQTPSVKRALKELNAALDKALIKTA